MKKDLTRILVNSIVRKTLKDIEDSPERNIRNLIDIGLDFSNGRFQRYFMETAQKMMQNQSSAYYALVKEAADHVNHDTLACFGINLGYNSCTSGAKTIREIEAKEHFNIPWQLTFYADSKNYTYYRHVIKQAKELGIYTYLLFIKGDPNKFIPLIKQHSDCAFILFLEPNQINANFFKAFGDIHNVMIAVRFDKSYPFAVEVCSELRMRKFLYSVYTYYNDTNQNYITSGKTMEDASAIYPVFVFLFASKTCMPKTKESVRKYTIETRDGQKYPSFIVDVESDNNMIDSVISDDSCMIAFNEDGCLYSDTAEYQKDEYNIFKTDLKDILRKAVPKKK
ncbi:MAG: hypothetical protein Q4G33_10090 [bacterium]|nr:hypothetical protein [bacterium]